MNILAKTLGYVATFIAGMAMIVLLQVETVFPTPETGIETMGWYIHPIYSFHTWVYVAVAVLFVALAVVFTLMGRRKPALEH